VNPVLVAVVCSVLPTLGNSTFAATVYANDFEAAVGDEWSIPLVASTATERHFLGQDPSLGFGNQIVTLTLNSLPVHTEITAVFDLFVINSWNGNDETPGKGPDLFSVFVGPTPSTSLVRTTFTNLSNGSQAYPDPFGAGSYDRWTGALEYDTLGYPAFDSVYRFSLTFAHTGDQLVLSFGATLTEPVADESWGLDNVHVSVNPDPGTFLLLAATAMICRRRRLP